MDNEQNEIFDENEETEVETGARNCLVPVYIFDILKANSNRVKRLSIEGLQRRLDQYPYAIDVKRQAIARILNTMDREHVGIHYTPDGSGAYYDCHVA